MASKKIIIASDDVCGANLTLYGNIRVLDTKGNVLRTLDMATLESQKIPLEMHFVLQAGEDPLVRFSAPIDLGPEDEWDG